ncbi:reverse transcriptase domain-containing protein [Tanacetum coccineum]
MIGILVLKTATSLGLLPSDPLFSFVLLIEYTVPPAMKIMYQLDLRPCLFNLKVIIDIVVCMYNDPFVQRGTRGVFGAYDAVLLSCVTDFHFFAVTFLLLLVERIVGADLPTPYAAITDEDLEFVDVQRALRYGLVNKGTETLDGNILTDCGKEKEEKENMVRSENKEMKRSSGKSGDGENGEEHDQGNLQRIMRSTHWPKINSSKNNNDGILLAIHAQGRIRKEEILIMAMDYFTNWGEAKPLASVTWKHIERFIWEHVKCLFVMPQMIVSDNRKQFEEGAFPQLCERFMIKQAFTSEYGQQGSRLTERAQVEIRKKLRLALLMERKQFHKKKPTSQQEKKLTLSKTIKTYGSVEFENRKKKQRL